MPSARAHAPLAGSCMLTSLDKSRRSNGSVGEPDDAVVLTVATHHHSEGAATRCDQFESSITVLKWHSTKIAPLIAS